MGTNYYAKIKICPTCKRPEEEVHLGKSSAGWTFSLQANGFKYYKNWPEMKRWLRDKIIENEYGEKVSLKDFIETVEWKKDVKDPEEVDYSSHPEMNKKIGGYTFHDCEFS